MPVNLTLPTDGGSSGLWGGVLNTALGALETFVNGLETSLAGKAAAVHTHTESDVDSLVSDLAGKSDVGHAHAAADITSGLLSVARGGTGVATLAELLAALGLGQGASIYRADASTPVEAGTGTRTLASYDTQRYADTGYTVALGSGTITVPDDGRYLVAGHIRLATGNATPTALILTDGTNELGRSTFATYTNLQDLGFSTVTDTIPAGSALRLQAFTSASSSFVGNAFGTYYMFRVMRVG